MTAHSSVPGIINLPQPKAFHQHQSSSRSTSPARTPFRHSSHPPQPEPTQQDKPADVVTGSRTTQVKRRNREKRGDSPLKHVADQAEPSPGYPPVADAILANDLAGTESPSKPARKRRGGRAARQPSPPMPPTADAHLMAPPLPAHSRSLPNLDARTTYTSLPVEDEWDMPATASAAGGAARGNADAPKESLSWQQELLRNGSVGSHSSSQPPRNGNSGSPISRPRSRGHVAKDQQRKQRPALTTSHSESFVASSSTLNWQQELLLRTDEVQLVQQVTVTAGPNATPARQRRNQIKDSITFGLANLDLAETAFDDSIGSPVAPASSRRQQKRTSHTPQVVVDDQLVATPTKSVEPRYAGPTFHNSPAPSALPMPSFMLRRQAETVATH